MKTILIVTCIAAISLTTIAASAQEWVLVESPHNGPAAEGPPSPREQERSRREQIRAQRRIDKLHRVMALEGPEFSRDKYEKYSGRMGFGIALSALGGISAISGALLGLANIFEGIDWTSEDEDDWDEEDGTYSEVKDERSPRQNAALGMFVGGLGAIAVGIPLIVSGIRGRNRQSYLQRKNEILRAGGYEVSLKLRVDPRSDSAAVALAVTF